MDLGECSQKEGEDGVVPETPQDQGNGDDGGDVRQCSFDGLDGRDWIGFREGMVFGGLRVTGSKEFVTGTMLVADRNMVRQDFWEEQSPKNKSKRQQRMSIIMSHSNLSPSLGLFAVAWWRPPFHPPLGGSTLPYGLDLAFLS